MQGIGHNYCFMCIIYIIITFKMVHFSCIYIAKWHKDDTAIIHNNNYLPEFSLYYRNQESELTQPVDENSK